MCYKKNGKYNNECDQYKYNVFVPVLFFLFGELYIDKR